MNDVNVENTAAARTSCEIITTGVAYYQNLIAELKTARTEMAQNWDGSAAADLETVMYKVDATIKEFEQKLIPSLQNLSTTVVAFADAIDETAANDVSEGATDTSNNIGNGEIYGPPAPTDTDKNNENSDSGEKPGFLATHGKNFADAWTKQDWAGTWDYSGCDAPVDYVGKTVDALIDSAGNIVDGTLDTIGAGVNFLWDAACEGIGWVVGLGF